MTASDVSPLDKLLCTSSVELTPRQEEALFYLRHKFTHSHGIQTTNVHLVLLDAGCILVKDLDLACGTCMVIDPRGNVYRSQKAAIDGLKVRVYPEKKRLNAIIRMLTPFYA